MYSYHAHTCYLSLLSINLHEKRSVRPCPFLISTGTTFQLADKYTFAAANANKIIFARGIFPTRSCQRVSTLTLLKWNALLTLAGSTLKDLLPSCGWILYRPSSFRPSVQFIKNMGGGGQNRKRNIIEIILRKTVFYHSSAGNCG